jgi:hypothetical protein
VPLREIGIVDTYLTVCPVSLVPPSQAKGLVQPGAERRPEVAVVTNVAYEAACELCRPHPAHLIADPRTMTEMETKTKTVMQGGIVMGPLDLAMAVHDSVP